MGKFGTILNDELRKEMKLFCVGKGITITNFVSDAIKEKLERDKEK